MNIVEALERQLKGYETAVEQMRMADKLKNNREFKKLILDEFCVQECARYAQLSADPCMNAEQRADSLGIAQAAGHLRRWLTVIEQKAKQAETQIPLIQAELDRARAGGDEDTLDQFEYGPDEE